MKRFLLILLSLVLTSATALAENYILYTSSDGKIVEPRVKAEQGYPLFDAHIVSNTYENGQGKILLDGDVKQIGQFAFENCTTLTSIVIPNSATIIDIGAFMQCTGLLSVEIPNSVTSIKWQAFYGCTNLKTVNIPNSVQSINKVAFGGCSSLKSVVIPNSVYKIGDGTFSDCTSLKTVVFSMNGYNPAIEYRVFGGCTSLTEIISTTTTPPIAYEETFQRFPIENCVLKVPAEAVEAYKTAEGWKDFRNIVGMSDEEITGIESIESQNSTLNTQNQFNLSGQRVGAGYKGILVKDGRKTIKK